jgi:hypothetical protein
MICRKLNRHPYHTKLNRVVRHLTVSSDSCEKRLKIQEGGVMVFSAIFNNISAISWRPVLLVEENGVPGENHRPVAS